MVNRTLLCRLVSLIFLASVLFYPHQATAGEARSECALSLITRLEEPRDKADALVEIANLYLQEQDKQTAERLLAEALVWIPMIEDGLSKAAAIVALSKIASIHDVDRAAQIAKSLGGSHRSWAYRELIVAYSRFCLRDPAVQLLNESAEYTKSEKNRNETWYGDREFEITLVFTEAARAGLTDEVLKLGKGVEDKFSKGDFLRAAAIALVEQKQYRRAIRVARSIHYEIERIEALVDVANAAAKTEGESSASEALSHALLETWKDHFDPEQDTKANALVSISLAYENNGDRKRALTVLERAVRVAKTIEKPGFRDAGLSKVALAYARFQMFDKALQVTDNIPSQWSDVKVHTLAGIAGYMIEAGERESAIDALKQAHSVAMDIDCTYFNYGISARSCFGNKAGDFIAIASAYNKAGLFEKAAEMLDLAMMQNKYRTKPPHQTIEEGSSFLSEEPVGEGQIIEGYLIAKEHTKAIDVARNIKNAKDRVVAIAILEFRLARDKSAIRNIC